MSSGIKIYNDDNQVIVSDLTSSFYYYGTASYVSQETHSTYGGCRAIRFNTYTSKPIIPFIRPADSLNPVGIMRIYRGTNSYWFIEVAVRGQDTATPTVHVFTTADAENWDSRFPGRDRKNGMKVYRDDGSVAFDSTVGKPLSVQTAFGVIPPATPISNSRVLTPDQYNEYSISGMQRPMFGWYSMAMTQRQYTQTDTSDKCSFIDVYGACIGKYTVTVRYQLWWAFYRSAAKISASKIDIGWLAYAYGYYDQTETKSSWSFLIPLFSAGGGTSGYGSVPYVNQTINLSYQNLLLTDEALYT